MSTYTPTIGLEIHAELKTNTKMFCDSKNDPDETEPNVNVCPVCMGHPGTLPVINKKAVKHIITIGHALGGEIADFTEFDRKNYFYPDIPKGYQISQYDYPLVSGGELAGVDITRIHLEEDTATSKHDEGTYSRVDFNRAGIPLMELVTEPVIESAQEAGDFARELQLLLRHLDIGEANMEKGEMRIEANVSVSKTDEMGTKVEVKNINSFKAVENAIAYEVKRQKSALESGEEITQETRGWDEDAAETFSQRTKETSEDYRYFPDPDLPKLKISEIEEFSEKNITEEMPELPAEKRDRYHQLGISDEDIETLLHSPMIANFFDRVVEFLDKEEYSRTAINYITSDLMGILDGEEEMPFQPPQFAGLTAMVETDKVSSRGAKNILEIMYEKGGDPGDIAEENDLLQKSGEDELRPVVKEVVEENEEVANDFREGKEEALQFLIGQGMQKTQGSANPQVLAEMLRQELSS